MTILPALALGLALGVRHATDADHVAAISTIVTESRSLWRAATIGVSWGIGHSASVLLVGGVLVLLRLPMPVRVALALEFIAALMLIGLGVRSIMWRRGTASPRGSIQPAAIGVVHGLAGSAVLALLVLSATDSAAAAAAYLVSFCLGTVAGMGLITAVLAVPARFGATRLAAFDRHIRVAAGIASLAIGLLLAHRVGVRDGLFAATPTWTPE
jgi:high-affinity nickel-transport protein